jgi:diadenosine tetraphosphate (Ap4A) HIT family hydrolase
MEKCLFCDFQKEKENVIVNNFFFTHWDENPICKGHMLIIPKRHIASFFELTQEELIDFYKTIKEAKNIIHDKYHPNAYNIGVNDGEAAGRTIHHLHIHLIPRYKGDCENPRGGVRKLFPEKADYTKEILPHRQHYFEN